ncbi:unnamed protein product [Macrosiphum euphorbiae]|uniref:Uncharacterized protein n=1 Tax=Macrosiphum euphorbiae TaxID=13131 RepID=A0AAV0WKY2_9HEMI|nr:unnamed protein product [Macrosiphum euphorbiae]
MQSVSRTALAVAEVPGGSGSGSVVVAVVGAYSGAGCSGCYCCFRYRRCTEAVTNVVVVCDHYHLLIFLLQQLRRHEVDASAAGVAIAHSAHPAFAAAVDALPADYALPDHYAVAGVVVVAAGSVAAGVVHAFAVDGDSGAAVDVDPSTSPTVDASAVHAVHAALPSADHVTQSVVLRASC